MVVPDVLLQVVLSSEYLLLVVPETYLAVMLRGFVCSFMSNTSIPSSIFPKASRLPTNKCSVVLCFGMVLEFVGSREIAVTLFAIVTRLVY